MDWSLLHFLCYFRFIAITKLHFFPPYSAWFFLPLPTDPASNPFIYPNFIQIMHSLCLLDIICIVSQILHYSFFILDCKMDKNGFWAGNVLVLASFLLPFYMKIQNNHNNKNSDKLNMKIFRGDEENILHVITTGFIIHPSITMICIDECYSLFLYAIWSHIFFLFFSSNWRMLAGRISMFSFWDLVKGFSKMVLRI